MNGCSVTLSGSGNVPLTVRVWTSLDGKNAKDESFGVNNVVIRNNADFQQIRFEGDTCPSLGEFMILS